MTESVYELVKILKQSEKSRVTLVRETVSNKVYIKKELNGPQYVYRKLLGQTWHYLPHVYETSYHDGVTIVLEEYIEGIPIHQASLSEKQIIRAFCELCKTLSFLHKQKIIHKDIKPENILIAGDGHIRLIDFDISRTQKEDVGHDTKILGTRGFAPPEQYGFAQTDARSDIYQAGITLKQLLGPLAKSGKYKKLIKKCTNLDPKKRFHSADSVIRYLKFKKVSKILFLPIILILFIIFSVIGVMTIILYLSAKTDPLVKVDINTAIYTSLPEQSNIREYVFSEVAPYMPYPDSDIKEYDSENQQTQKYAQTFSCQEAWEFVSS